MFDRSGSLRTVCCYICLLTLHLVSVPSSAETAAMPLKPLVVEALQNNPDIQAAKQELEAAQSGILPAAALDDPMLEAGVVSLPTTLRFDQEPMTMRMIGIGQRLPYPGKRGLRREVAEKEAEAAGHRYQETINRIIRDVKVAYFDLALNLESARLVGENKQILEQFLKTAEIQYAVGKGQQADVLKAQIELARMEDELIRLARERRLIEAELNRALGRTTDSPLPSPEFLRQPEIALSLDALREDARIHRPKLRALQSMIDRGAKLIELARKDYYPDFDVRFSYGQRDTLEGGMRQDDMLSFTVAINLPVWREIKLDPRVAEAEAKRTQVLSMYEAELNELDSRLRQEVANAGQSLKSAKLYETGILPQAKIAVEAALAAYRVGRVDFLTLLDNQMTVFNYELSHASAITSYNKALAEIEFITGKMLF